MKKILDIFKKNKTDKVGRTKWHYSDGISAIEFRKDGASGVLAEEASTSADSGFSTPTGQNEEGIHSGAETGLGNEFGSYNSISASSMSLSSLLDEFERRLRLSDAVSTTTSAGISVSESANNANSEHDISSVSTINVSRCPSRKNVTLSRKSRVPRGMRSPLLATNSKVRDVEDKVRDSQDSFKENSPHQPGTSRLADTALISPSSTVKTYESINVGTPLDSLQQPSTSTASTSYEPEGSFKGRSSYPSAGIIPTMIYMLHNGGKGLLKNVLRGNVPGYRKEEEQPQSAVSPSSTVHTYASIETDSTAETPISYKPQTTYAEHENAGPSVQRPVVSLTSRFRKVAPAVNSIVRSTERDFKGLLKGTFLNRGSKTQATGNTKASATSAMFSYAGGDSAEAKHVVQLPSTSSTPHKASVLSRQLVSVSQVQQIFESTPTRETTISSTPKKRMAPTPPSSRSPSVASVGSDSRSLQIEDLFNNVFAEQEAAPTAKLSPVSIPKKKQAPTPPKRMSSISSGKSMSHSLSQEDLFNNVFAEQEAAPTAKLSPVSIPKKKQAPTPPKREFSPPRINNVEYDVPLRTGLLSTFLKNVGITADGDPIASRHAGVIPQVFSGAGKSTRGEYAIPTSPAIIARGHDALKSSSFGSISDSSSPQISRNDAIQKTYYRPQATFTTFTPEPGTRTTTPEIVSPIMSTSMVKEYKPEQRISVSSSTGSGSRKSASGASFRSHSSVSTISTSASISSDVSDETSTRMEDVLRELQNIKRTQSSSQPEFHNSTQGSVNRTSRSVTRSTSAEGAVPGSSTPRTENAANVWRSGGVDRKEISLQGASAKKVVVKRAAPVIPSVSPDILPQPKLTQKAPFAYTGLQDSIKNAISTRKRSSVSLTIEKAVKSPAPVAPSSSVGALPKLQYASNVSFLYPNAKGSVDSSVSTKRSRSASPTAKGVKRAAPVIPSVSPDILPQPKLTQKAPFAYTGLPESVKSTISRRRSSIREAGTVGTAGVQKTALVNSTKAISKPVVTTNIPVNPQRWSVHGTYSSRFAAAKEKFGSQTSRYAIPLRQESKSGYAIATTKVVSTPSINQAQVTTFVQKLNQGGSSGFGTKGKVGLLIRQFEDNSFSSPRPQDGASSMVDVVNASSSRSTSRS